MTKLTRASIAGVFAMVLSVAWYAVCEAFHWSTFAIFSGAIAIGGGVGAAIVVAWE